MLASATAPEVSLVSCPACSICDKCYNVVRVLTCAVMTYSECFKLCFLAQDCKPAMFTCMVAWLQYQYIMDTMADCTCMRKANCTPTRILWSEPAVPRCVCARACVCLNVKGDGRWDRSGNKCHKTPKHKVPALKTDAKWTMKSKTDSSHFRRLAILSDWLILGYYDVWLDMT